MPDSLIHDSGKSRIYLHRRSEDEPPVALKVLNLEYPTPAEVDRFYNEYEIIHSLKLEHCRNVLGKTRMNQRHAMFLEWYEGYPLSNMDLPMELEQFLVLCSRMSTAIEEIHDHGIIHKDLNPNNILIDKDAGVRIIDFGIASTFDIMQHRSENPEWLEGTLAYNSPEESGRMNRRVDHRSDLYSLGVIMYEMITGQLPFITDDPMEMIHSHIARDPDPPHSISTSIPLQVSRIIMKLMSKKAEDRYQSAHGLRQDIETCLDSYRASRFVHEFPLAGQDHLYKFTLPQKLYGRAKEIDSLINAFDNCALGDLSTMLVSGYSGTGKSVLVHEVHKPITARRGYFIEGKFDQYQRSVPYSAFLSAFVELVDILLTEREARLELVKKEILEAVGEEGRVLTNVIPNLVHIIGEQPEIPELPGTESQNRFNYMIRKFVKAISTSEHPIVLFIDDMQWADSASLYLLRTLMTDFENKYLLFIAAYRENEVDESHPFMIIAREVAEAGANISRIGVGNLTKTDVEEMVSDTIQRRDEETRELAEIVFTKTRGNAFFVTQFLKNLYEDKLIQFDPAKRQWVWDRAGIGKINVADNVVDLVAGNILKLSDETQEVLKLAACIGSTFSSSTIAEILGLDSAEVEKRLKPGLKDALINPHSSSRYKFSHDRIQQAVYSLLNDTQKQEMHFTIARLWLEKIDDPQRSESIFDTVNQWNQATVLIEPGLRSRIAELNLKAGVKARENSAFENAYDYFRSGIDLLNEGHWKLQYELSLSLHHGAIEAAYLCQDFGQVEVLFGTIIEHTKDTLERVKAYEVRIHAFKAQNKLLDSIAAGIEILRELGEKFPKKPNMFHVFKDLAVTAWMLRGLREQDLLDRPEMNDPVKKAALRIGADIMPSVYWATPNLVPVLAFRMVRLSLRFGNSPVSAFAYGSYGVLMCGVLEFMNTGHTFGKLAIRLLEKLDAKEWKAQIYVTTYGLILFWKEHIRNTLPPLRDSYHIGLETGAIEFACVNTNIYCIHAFLSGRPLVKLEEEARNYSSSFKEFGQMTNFYYNEVYRQSMLNFISASVDDPLVLTGDAYDEDHRMKINTENNDQTGTFFIHFNKMILAYYFGAFEQAVEQAGKARKLLQAVLAKFEIPNLLFYEALSHIALYETSKGRYGSLVRARKNRRKLRKWAKYAPENFEHKQLIIQAELQRVKGRIGVSTQIFDQAVKTASANEYLHEEALALQLTGRMHYDTQSTDLAEHYLKLAHNRFLEWGSQALAERLEGKYPDIKLRTPVQRSREGSVLTTVKHSDVLDIGTVLKASTSISGEVVLSKLIKKLLNLLVENAGAQRGVLLLQRDRDLLIQGEFNPGEGLNEVLQNRQVDKGTLPDSLLNFVLRTRETVAINDRADRRFTADPYFVEVAPQSVLCFPIIHQGKFQGIIYLEHRSMVGVFREERLELLSLLSGQIAVSIDNAILYRQLEQKVDERTRELAQEKKKSDDLLHNILPQETAEELKLHGKTVPRQFESVTVLFTDFVDFTRASENLSPEEIVSAINTCFSAFDNMLEKHSIEKIKTIGDSYMCAGGLPVPNSTHPADCVHLALEMRDYIHAFNSNRSRMGLPELRIRIGIHTGPVVAGVVGTRKFAYDIWGDTVNTASRMESSGEPGMINISGETYSLVRSEFRLVERGRITAKNKGDLEMYFVEGIK